MRVLYAIQGTGNGHMSRAMEVIPALQERVNVDVLISGNQVDLELPFPVRYRYAGYSFIFGKNGGINFRETWKRNSLRRLIQDICRCPVHGYDLVINDFEPVSAWACRLNGIKCVSFSHQAAMRSNKVPKPKFTDWIGAFILKYYAPFHTAYSFHFDRYDERMFTPVIRKTIREKEISDQGHYTVYLPAYADEKLISTLTKIPNISWEVFSKHTSQSYFVGNVHVQPIHGDRFIESLSSASGILCGAGFETPAEALYLMKKLLVIPMKQQYEQQCNAAALKQMGVPVIKSLNKKGVKTIADWVKNGQPIKVYYPDQTQFLVDQLLEQYIQSIEVEVKKHQWVIPKFVKMG